MSHLLPTYAPFPIEFTHGKASTLFDKNEKPYTDFLAGIAVTNLGHSHPELIQVLQSQSEKFWHLSNYFKTTSQEALAEKLVNLSFPGKVFFSNSGAEANEGALKLARKYTKENFHEKKTKIIRFKHAFHGRTFMALSITENETAKTPFAPYPAEIITLPLNDQIAAEQYIDTNTSAVIIEPIQGESGVIPSTKEFLQVLRKKCNETGAVLIFDEVQCGIGRTGNFWGYQTITQSSICPDIITFAKGIANGVPMGGFLVKEDLSEVLKPGEHGSTFGGNPIAVAVANKVVEIISQKKILENVKKSGNFLTETLQKSLNFPSCDKRGLSGDMGVSEIRGYGLMQAIEGNFDAKELVKKALEEGIILNAPRKNTIRIVPPLIITKKEIEKLGEFLKKYFL